MLLSAQQDAEAPAQRCTVAAGRRHRGDLERPTVQREHRNPHSDEATNAKRRLWRHIGRLREYSRLLALRADPQRPPPSDKDDEHFHNLQARLDNDDLTDPLSPLPERIKVADALLRTEEKETR